MKPLVPIIAIGGLIFIMGNGNVSSQMYGETESPFRRPPSAATAAPSFNQMTSQFADQMHKELNAPRPVPQTQPVYQQVPTINYPAPVHTEDFLRPDGTYANPHWQMIRERVQYGQASPETLRAVEQSPRWGSN